MGHVSSITSPDDHADVVPRPVSPALCKPFSRFAEAVSLTPMRPILGQHGADCPLAERQSPRHRATAKHSVRRHRVRPGHPPQTQRTTDACGSPYPQAS